MSMDLFFLLSGTTSPFSPCIRSSPSGNDTKGVWGAEALSLPSGGKRPGPSRHRVSRGGLGLHTFDIVALMQPGVLTPGQQRFAFILFYLGFGILAGVWPFHTWSPVGHVAAPTSVSMIHAGVLMKVGAFGILRVAIFLCPIGWEYWAP